MANNPFRQLPAVNDVLELPAVQGLAQHHAHAVIVAAVRRELAELRERLTKGQTLNGRSDAATVAERVAERLERG